jgi:HD superfamily phosphodiesterase
LFELETVRARAKHLLSTGLSEKLTYHCFPHTIWVVESCLTIAKNEGVKNAADLKLLETAAWLHDVGFVRTYFNHEEKSCEIATEILTEIGASKVEIKKVCELIMSTQIPQKPCCHLGQIICDADLDYLGREDFYPWSQRLRDEWYNFGIIKTQEEFEERQLRFLNAHRYHTRDAQMRREPVKQMFLKELMKDQNIRLSA